MPETAKPVPLPTREVPIYERVKDGPLAGGEHKPSVYLLVPHYSHDVAMGAARGIQYATRGRVDVFGVADATASITPHSFNGLLAMALAERDNGKVTHAAMLHSDIAPEPGWIDTLFEEMWIHGAQAVSAVVPIKEDEKSRTSTAWGTIGKPFDAPRYVRMEEKHLYPPTFGQEHGRDGEELLINTGCLLMDLRWPHWDDFAFTFTTRIARTQDGGRLAQVRPEDWDMSRFVRERGGKVFATWRVKLEHYGWHAWKNH